jgi:hypothetical protein
MVSKWFLMSYKFVFTKSRIFIDKGHICYSLFKMNMMTIITRSEDINKIVSFFFPLTYDMWHDKFRLMNYIFMQRLVKPEFLTTMIFEKNYKCQICVE